jgi:hypothetical protein
VSLQGPNGLQQASWGDALAAIAGAAQGLQANEFKAIAGKLADAESMIALKVGSNSSRASGCSIAMCLLSHHRWLFHACFACSVICNWFLSVQPGKYFS